MLRRARPFARWLIGTGRPLVTEGNVLALSPHLDDVVFSVGATLAHAIRHGAQVTVLTVFACDPGSREHPGSWDARAGFRSQGEAAAQRRREDERACSLLGASCRWLPFADAQYPQPFSDDDLAAALESELENPALVLIPGFPLEHPDHARLHELVLPRIAPERTVLYVEQPYAVWTNATMPHGWSAAPAGLPDRLRKIRACRAYRSQLPLLDVPNPPTRVARHEAARGGELIRTAS